MVVQPRRALVLVAALVIVAGWLMPALPADPVVIIVNKSNKADNLSSKMLRQIFSGEQTHWPDGLPIQTLASTPDTPEHAAAIYFLFHMTEADYKRYLLEESYTGKTNSAPKESGPSRVVVNLVGLIPGAISFSRLSLVNDNVKVLKIDGLSPGVPAYPIVVK